MKKSNDDQASVASRVSRILSDRAAARRRNTPTYGSRVGSASNDSQTNYDSAKKINKKDKWQSAVTDKQFLNMRNLLLKSNSRQQPNAYERSDISEPPRFMPKQMSQKSGCSKTSVTSLSLRRFNELIHDSRQQENNLSEKRSSSRNKTPSIHSSHRVLNLIARRHAANNIPGAAKCQFRDAHLAAEKAHPCQSKIYRLSLCKRHHLDTVKNKILTQARTLYTNPISAFSQLDFNGKGYVTLDGFLKSACITKTNVGQEDVFEFLRNENLFDLSDPESKVNFQKISRTLFPQMYQIKRDDALEKDGQLIDNLKGELERDSGQDLVQMRLRDLEKLIITRFEAGWEEVRKAFLDMDFDHDGYVTIEDFMRLFHNDASKINVMDLKKLLMEKDHSKKGRLNYSDFSQWLGQAIHWSEGFYFRHDSIKNPPFERTAQTYEKLMKDNKVEDTIMKLRNLKQLETLIWEKLGQQWKTVKKAYRDLSNNDPNGIKPAMLKKYLDNWGMRMSDEEFQYIFTKFDLDSDGIISYRDFLDSAGPECFPKEGLFFRQDISIKARGKDKVCAHPYCCVSCLGLTEYCAVHLKLHREKGLEIFMKVKQRISSKTNKSTWGKFMTELISEMESISQPDSCLIEMDVLFSMFERHGAPLRETQKTLLKQVFLVIHNNRDNTYMLNVSKLMQLQVHQDVGTYYDKAAFGSDKQPKEVVDLTGYHGIFFREKRKLEKLSWQSFLVILSEEERFMLVMRTIRQIDKDRNGYITNQEMEDILKMYYKNELGDKDIEPHIHKYTSPLNRVLVDYKSLCKDVEAEIERVQKIPLIAAQIVSPQKSGQITIDVGSTEKHMRPFDATSLEKFIHKSDSIYMTKRTPTQFYSTHNEIISSPPNEMKASKSQAAIGVKSTKNVQVPNDDMFSQVARSDLALILPHQIRTAKNIMAKSAIRNQKDIVEKNPTIGRSLTQTNIGDKSGRRLHAKMHIIKQKLACNWKNLYRTFINFYDFEQTGSLQTKFFEQSLHSNGLYLNKSDLLMLYRKFGSSEHDEQVINYLEMGKVLSLDSNNIRCMVMNKMASPLNCNSRSLLSQYFNGQSQSYAQTLLNSFKNGSNSSTNLVQRQQRTIIRHNKPSPAQIERKNQPPQLII